MKDILAILRRELDHLLHGLQNLHTDHGIHGYLPPLPRNHDGARPR